MKNILFLHVGAEMYGSDKVLYQIVTGLNPQKYHPIVVLPEHGELENAMLQAGIEVRVINYPIMRRKFFSIIGIFQYAISYLHYSGKLRKLLKECSIDLVYVNTIAVLEGVYLYLFSKTPVLWHIHEILTTPKAIYKFTSFLIGRFDNRVIAISNATKKHLIDSGFVKSDKVQIIYNGIDNVDVDITKNMRSELNISEDSFVFGHVGRVNVWKGQEDFLQASIPLLKKYKKMHILFSGNAFPGEEWREEELISKINNNPDIRNRIHYLGYQRNTDKIFETMDVFITSSTRPEPFSMVTIEAMNHSKPVIAYDVGGPAEIVEDKVTGLLSQFQNIDQLQKNMEFMITHPDVVTRMGENSKKRIDNNFSISKFNTQIDEICDKLITKN
ncbi:glycosyltransferase family 4 protein [Latilactobacillus curvatus]|uniref:glycosyltransferase family 4 protein n=1 Tax=Latilactobacillus curvatus TaxID=28038 RepID=UPI003CF359A4